MTHLRRSIFWTGGLMLAALALTMAVPRAAHAVPAALVQVTNTAAIPAITQPVSTLASQQVILNCTLSFPSYHCLRVNPGGLIQQPELDFVIPDGQSLVISAIHTDVSSVPATVYLYPVSGIYGTTMSWTFAGDNLTHDVLIPNGVVWPAGNAVSVGTSNNHALWLYGYLTAN